LQAKTRILIADDDQAMAKSLAEYLSRRNFDVAFAVSHEESLRTIRSFDPSLVLLDYTLPPVDGGETLERLKQLRPELPVIVYSGDTAPEVIFRMSKLGAEDYIATPFQLSDLFSRISRVMEKRVATEGDAQLRDRVRQQSDFSTLFGTSSRMEEIKNTIEQVADTNATVLIRGESGTGKEVVARMIHRESLRRDKPFVKVNCAAIPHELLESELFGYEPGAFTGANKQKLGKFDQANYGTLFLDEISEMHPALQAKLLHVLQDGTYCRLGGRANLTADARILAATNIDIQKAIAEKRLREDLYYRLNAFTMTIPPLRERREEIPLLLKYFMNNMATKFGKNPLMISDRMVKEALAYHWPGNLRELGNFVKRYLVMENEDLVLDELQTKGKENNGEAGTPSSAKGGLKAMVRSLKDDAEAREIQRALEGANWNRKVAAAQLNISYKALLYKIKQHGLAPAPATYRGLRIASSN